MKKHCFKCGRKKDLSLFYRHSEMADGHLGKCKKCTKTDVRIRYYDPEGHARIVAYERDRFKNPERKKKVLQYQRARRHRSPGKERARNKISSLISSGVLKRLPCEVCGTQRAQAHHLDYRRPLHIRWLCFKHHREVHLHVIASNAVDTLQDSRPKT